MGYQYALEDLLKHPLVAPNLLKRLRANSDHPVVPSRAMPRSGIDGVPDQRELWLVVTDNSGDDPPAMDPNL